MEKSFSERTLQDYEVLSVIGNGAFGTCFKVRYKLTGDLYAWKATNYDELSKQQQEFLISEIQVLRQLNHSNIVQYYHHIINEETKSIFIIMEYCEGGDLAQLIAKAKATNRRLEEGYIWQVLFQICRALQVCHNNIKGGTILHRDIKPANIFLDTSGNVKLGDFGLARKLRRSELFAETFVGTPYYMSPEIVKGTKYDRKSDVWAVGCLIYEMCTLRPPFRGREFDQLSANISIGKFSSIPPVYSTDLQDIINFMLEIDIEQRPSVEIISRHPIVIRNVSNLSSSFPHLVDVESEYLDIYGKSCDTAKCTTGDGNNCHQFSSTTTSKFDIINKNLDDKLENISRICTPDLKAELFYSAKRKIFPQVLQRQQSDPAIYDTIRLEENYIIKKPFSETANFRVVGDPSKEGPHYITQNVFKEILLQRLQAIRAQESLLQLKEESLNAREQQLKEKECRLIAFEEKLIENHNQLNERLKKYTIITGITNEAPPFQPPPPPPPPPPPAPPVPPRKASKHDETYCSIDPNDLTLLNGPTMVKINLPILPKTKSKANTNLRKVTFQSPKKFITYNIDSSSVKATSVERQMQSSAFSKGSENSAANLKATVSGSTQRRKSIFSLLGISRLTKDTTIKANCNKTQQIILNNNNDGNKNSTRDEIIINEKRILSKCETAELTNIWTEEHKRAAFQLLAAMNANNCAINAISHPAISSSCNTKSRQSIRERNSIHRNRLRRSYIAPNLLNRHANLTGKIIL